MKPIETDIIIIGGGPAGSTTAIYLKKLGYDITLVEKKKFPRETLCGEFLSQEVTDILKEVDLFKDFWSLDPIQLKKIKVIDDSGKEIQSPLNFDAYAMKRSVFDSLLLDNAKSKHVNLIQPATVNSVKKINSGFISEIVNESDEVVQLKSKLVIGAYGKQNPLDKKLNRGFISKKSFLNGVKFHLPVELLNEKFCDEIRIYTNDGLYCGMNQVSKSEITVCFLENRKKNRTPSRERLIEMIGRNRSFRNIFSERAIAYLHSANIYGTGNIYFGKREVVEKGIIMAGDSARVIAPLAGDGIGMAMESAKILYDVLSKYKLNQNNLSGIFQDYANQYEKAFNKRLKTARIVQRLILNNKLRKIGFSLADKYPSIITYIIKLTRSGSSK